MPDDYYPKALQWCNADDIPNDVFNINMCKSYPNILLKNNTPVSIYTIEKFNCKSDLRQAGEFYIDETTLNNY